MKRPPRRLKITEQSKPERGTVRLDVRRAGPGANTDRCSEHCTTLNVHTHHDSAFRPVWTGSESYWVERETGKRVRLSKGEHE